ncbi:hypothetical protein HPULCUR_000596 [Helicostylum pulchrum]|uniref:Pentacotripeptide-repeat region of PRORP domain-containing protein n=1 Tax=Helicostylum pulchrum TaxID=562976 RepID=A0ABP9XKB2_9FUNG
MTIRHLPLSRSVIVNVLYAIVSRPIDNHALRSSSTKSLLRQQPLTSMFAKVNQCGIQRLDYSTQTSPAIEYDDNTTDTTHTDTKKRQYNKCRTILKKTSTDSEKKAFNGLVQKTKKPRPTSVVEYNRLIVYSVRENRINKAISLLREMEKNGLKPDVYTYTMIITEYSKQSDMIRARKWLNRMLKNKIDPDAYIYTSLIDGYMREANVDKAEVMFRIMMKRDIKPTLVTYNILMHQSVRQLNMESALKFWGNLLEAGLKSDVYTFAIILHGLGNEGRVDEAWRIFKTMEEQNVNVNEVVVTTLMGMHVKQHDNEYAIQLFNKFFTTTADDDADAADKKPLTITNQTRNVLLNAVVGKADSETISKYYDLYKKCITDKETSPLFIGANVYTYTTFMRAFLRRDNLAMVSQVYSDMVARNIQPSLVTYSTLMLAHAYVPDPESCVRILEELKRGGIELNAVLYTIVMRAWAKAGKWENVKSTYELMKQDNIQPTKLTMEVLRYGGSKSVAE